MMSSYLATLSPLQYITALLLVCFLVSIPAAVFIDMWRSAREEEAKNKRNTRYIYKGTDEDGTPIYLALPKEE